MLNLQSIERQARAVRAGELDPEDFLDWYSDYAFGYRGPEGNQIADALAEVDAVVAGLSLGEFEQTQLGERVERAIHPFVVELQRELGNAIRPASTCMVVLFQFETDPISASIALGIQDRLQEPWRPRIVRKPPTDEVQMAS